MKGNSRWRRIALKLVMSCILVCLVMYVADKQRKRARALRTIRHHGGFYLTTDTILFGCLPTCGIIKEIDTVMISDVRLSAEDMGAITALSNITHLALSSCDLDSGCAAIIGQLRRLEYLNVSDTPMTDEDVRHLANCAKLDELRLCDTRITDAAIPSLCRLKKLRYLSICFTAISRSAVLKLLEELPDLQRLEIIGTVASKEALDGSLIDGGNVKLIY